MQVMHLHDRAVNHSVRRKVPRHSGPASYQATFSGMIPPVKQTCSSVGVQAWPIGQLAQSITAFIRTCSSVSLGQLAHKGPQLLHPQWNAIMLHRAPLCKVHAARQGCSPGHLVVLVIKPACM
jgi:hypothetical protein